MSNDPGEAVTTPFAVILDELIVVEPADGFTREHVTESILGMLDAAGFQIRRKPGPVEYPALCADPAWRSGDVCFTNEPRVPVTMVAELCIGLGPDEVHGNRWDLSDRDILVACWWTITREHHRGGDRRTALGRWAHEAHPLLWSTRGELPSWPPLTPGWSAL